MKLKEDVHPEDFVLILAVLHLRSDLVPRKITMDAPLQLSNDCVRFQVRKPIEGWAKTWIDALLPDVTMDIVCSISYI